MSTDQVADGPFDGAQAAALALSAAELLDDSTSGSGLTIRRSVSVARAQDRRAAAARLKREESQRVITATSVCQTIRRASHHKSSPLVFDVRMA